jgi:hypothetical protein
MTVTIAESGISWPAAPEGAPRSAASVSTAAAYSTAGGTDPTTPPLSHHDAITTSLDRVD